MKIRKIQLARLLENLMQSYNVFTNKEALQSKVEGWYDKLQYQNEEFVTKIMSNWNGTKMPTAVDILKKCFDLHAEQKNSYAASDFICEYYKHSHAWEYECEVSKSLCYNNWNEDEKNNINLGNVDLNGQVFMVCCFHRIKLRSIFEPDENSKILVESLMASKKQNSASDLYSLTKDLTTKLRVA